MENKENVKVETNVEVSEAVQEVKAQGFFSKAGAWIKKHGKKVAVGAAILAGAAIGVAVLGKKNKSDDSECYDEDVVEDITDVDYSEVDNIE